MQKNEEHILSTKGLSKSFDGIQAVSSFSYNLYGPGICALIGPNGAGKTTLFNVITGFTTADSGEVRYEGNDISSLRPFQISRLGIARTFQDLRLLYQVPVLDNVILGCPKQTGERWYNAFLRPRKVFQEERKNREQAEYWLDFVGLADYRYDLAEELSYGQQKLLSLACCLATEGNLLLLDEPVSGVNPDMIEKILELLEELASKGKTIFFIEHNIESVKEISDRVIMMDEGCLIADGAPEKVLDDAKIIEAYLD